MLITNRHPDHITRVANTHMPDNSNDALSFLNCFISAANRAINAELTFGHHLQINGSLARAAIRELLEEGSIKPVAHHSAQGIYTRATAA